MSDRFCSALARRLGRPWALLSISLTLICLTTPMQGRAKVQVIRADMGGDLQQRLDEVERLRGQDIWLRIEGICVSACTLYLGLPKACVADAARLGFHGPRSRLAGLPLPWPIFDHLSQQMARHYPPPLRRWFMTKARLVTRDYYELSGAQAVAMGARRCE